MTKAKKDTVIGIPADIFFRGLVWILVGWVAIAILVATWTTRNKVKIPTNERYQLRMELYNAEKEVGAPDSIMKIQRLRGKLILDYLNKGQVVLGRKELLTYTNFLETNPNLSLKDRVETRSQLAIIYMTLNDFEPALKQYDAILSDLKDSPDYESRLLKARMLNDRGIANYLCGQSFDSPKLMKHYLQHSQKDFNECHDLLEQLLAEHPWGDTGRDDLINVLKFNKEFFDDDMLFIPKTSRP